MNLGRATKLLQFICYKISHIYVIKHHEGGFMATVFEYTSYKKFLKDLVANRGRGAIGEFSLACGCDRTYFSQVLGGKAQLTFDHALGLAEEININESEKNYFLMMVLRDRAGSPKAREILDKRMSKLEKDHLILSKQIKSKDSPAEASNKNKIHYYSSYLFSATHILASIEEYQTLAKIAARLRVDERTAKHFLDQLVEMGFVKKQGDRYLHAGGNLHISSDSPLNIVNHVNYRTKVVSKLTTIGVGEDVHYSSSFSISKKDWSKLRSQIMKFIEEHRATVHTSGSEEAYCMALDLFRLD